MSLWDSSFIKSFPNSPIRQLPLPSCQPDYSTWSRLAAGIEVNILSGIKCFLPEQNRGSTSKRDRDYEFELAVNSVHHKSLFCFPLFPYSFLPTLREQSEALVIAKISKDQFRTAWELTGIGGPVKTRGIIANIQRKQDWLRPALRREASQKNLWGLPAALVELGGWEWARSSWRIK